MPAQSKVKGKVRYVKIKSAKELMNDHKIRTTLEKQQICDDCGKVCTQDYDYFRFQTLTKGGQCRRCYFDSF